jgi:hypothetical protein
VNAALAALICAGSAAALKGDTIVATYEPAGVQTPNTTELCAGSTECYVGMEDFNSWSGTKPFSGTYPELATVGSLTGAINFDYTGSLTRSAANAYGGAGGTGYYPTVTDSSYTLTLTVSGDIPGVNYFGLWFSALDNGNQLQFYENTTLLYTFTPADFAALVGACPGSAFCGNPNNGDDANEQFAFLNFFDEDGYFNKIVFTETTSAGFESDNHTVAYMNPVVPSGTLIDGPEPNSMALLAAGAAILMGLKWRSRMTSPALAVFKKSSRR